MLQFQFQKSTQTKRFLLDTLKTKQLHRVDTWLVFQVNEFLMHCKCIFHLTLQPKRLLCCCIKLYQQASCTKLLRVNVFELIYHASSRVNPAHNSGCKCERFSLSLLQTHPPKIFADPFIRASNCQLRGEETLSAVQLVEMRCLNGWHSLTHTRSRISRSAWFYSSSSSFSVRTSTWVVCICVKLIYIHPSVRSRPARKRQLGRLLFVF